MKGQTHALVGAGLALVLMHLVVGLSIAGLVAAWTLHTAAGLMTYGELLVVGVLAALAPDIDSPRSTISKWWRIALSLSGLAVGGVFLYAHEWRWAAGAAIAGVVLAWVRLPVAHRTVTHWIVPTALFAGLGTAAVALFVFDSTHALDFGLVVALCWTSHTLLDTTNEKPVEVAPGRKWRTPLVHAYEGEWLGNLEELLAVALVGLLVVYVMVAR